MRRIGLPGLRRGTMHDFFQMEGMLHVDIDLLNMSVRYWMP